MIASPLMPILRAISASTPAPNSPALAGAEEPQIRDIAPPIDVFPYPPWMVALAAALALIVLGLAVWLIVRAIRNRPAPPPPSPRTVAIRELEALRAQLGKIGAYPFSIAVSDVLRRFVGAHFQLHAERQTSPEFLAAIAKAPQFSDDDRALLAQFLERCDMIKFARVEADSEVTAQLLSHALAFVQGARA